MLRQTIYFICHRVLSCLQNNSPIIFHLYPGKYSVRLKCHIFLHLKLTYPEGIRSKLWENLNKLCSDYYLQFLVQNDLHDANTDNNPLLRVLVSDHTVLEMVTDVS